MDAKKYFDIFQQFNADDVRRDLNKVQCCIVQHTRTFAGLCLRAGKTQVFWKSFQVFSVFSF